MNKYVSLEDYANTLQPKSGLRMTVLDGLSPNHPKLYVNSIYAGGNNRGKALHESAFRMRNLLGLDQVELCAQWSSHCAHYQCGFRSYNEETNLTIANLIAQSKKENKRVDSSFLHSVNMYIPDDIIAQKKIEFNITPNTNSSIYVYLNEKADVALSKNQKPLKVLLDNKIAAKEFSKEISQGLVLEIDIAKTPGYVSSNIITVERLQSLIASPFNESFNLTENWQQIKVMAQKAISFADDYLIANPIETTRFFIRHQDQQPLRDLKQVAIAFLTSPVTSSSQLGGAYFEFFNKLFEAQFLVKDWKKKFDDYFLNDIYETFHNLLGTTLEKTSALKGLFDKSSKPVLPLEDYLQTLKTQVTGISKPATVTKTARRDSSSQ